MKRSLKLFSFFFFYFVLKLPKSHILFSCQPHGKFSVQIHGWSQELRNRPQYVRFQQFENEAEADKKKEKKRSRKKGQFEGCFNKKLITVGENESTEYTRKPCGRTTALLIAKVTRERDLRAEGDRRRFREREGE